MFHHGRVFLGWAFLVLISACGHSAVIVADTGRDAYGWQARTDEFGVSSWSQTNSYEEVKIVARLYSVATNDHGIAYLMRRVGPGATAADEVAKAAFAFPWSYLPEDVVIFTNLNLGPGTYHLIVAGGTNYWSAWYGTDQPTNTTDFGVERFEDVYAYPIAPYLPASPLNLHSYMHHIFKVTGYRPGENRAPLADAGPDQTVECNGDSTSVFLDGRSTRDPEGDALTYAWWEENTQIGTGPTITAALTWGTYTIRLVVTDASGNSSEDTMTVTVADTKPPLLRAAVLPATLWPANGKMVPVTVKAAITDGCDSGPRAWIYDVTCDDPTATRSDWELTGDLTLNLRARRASHGQARTYKVGVMASDYSGNTVLTNIPVVVGNR